jgi:hypothetical protein
MVFSTMLPRLYRTSGATVSCRVWLVIEYFGSVPWSSTLHGMYDHGASVSVRILTRVAANDKQGRLACPDGTVDSMSAQGEHGNSGGAVHPIGEAAS